MLASEFGSVVWRRSPDITCERMRSTSSVSKRGAVSASCRSPNASVLFSFSIRSEPRK